MDGPLQSNKNLGGEGIVGLGRALSSAHRMYDFENPDRKFRGRVMLQRSPKVKELYLSGSPIGDVGAAAIADAIKSSSSIETLDISDCGLTDAGGSAIADALRISSSLVRLNIAANPEIVHEETGVELRAAWNGRGGLLVLS